MRRGGHLAFWGATHVFPDGGDPFFREIQTVYDEIGEALPPGQLWVQPGGLDDERTDIEQSSLFEAVDIRHFDWDTVYDADGYIDLLNTFSGHIAMEQWQRDRLYGTIQRTARHASRQALAPALGRGTSHRATCATDRKYERSRNAKRPGVGEPAPRRLGVHCVFVR